MPETTKCMTFYFLAFRYIYMSVHIDSNISGRSPHHHLHNFGILQKSKISKKCLKAVRVCELPSSKRFNRKASESIIISDFVS